MEDKEKKAIETQIELLMHPVRLRIVQYLMRRGEAAARELANQLSDVPQATLYRHLKKLTLGGVLEVVREIPIRGTVEKTYDVVDGVIKQPQSASQQQIATHAFMMVLGKDLDAYFHRQEAKILEEPLLFQTMALNLSDEEFEEVMGQLQSICEKAIDNKLTEGRKVRQLVLISVPPPEDKREQEKKNEEGKGERDEK